jgi:hypothetical protein
MLFEVINNQAAGLPEFGAMNARFMTRSAHGPDTFMPGVGHHDTPETSELVLRIRGGSVGFACFLLGF